MRLLVFILTVSAFAQSDVKRTIIPKQDDSATGTLEFREKYANGIHVVKFSAPSSLAATLQNFWPSAHPTANGQCLTATTAGVWSWMTCASGAVDLVTTNYDWSRTPGGSLTAATPATVTLSTCPDGVAPYVAHYSVRISGGVGTAETVLVTAVSTSGSDCDVSFTPANNHSGSWTVASASDGIQEAVNLATGAHRVFVPQGVHVLDPKAPGENSVVYVQAGISIEGMGSDPGSGGSALSVSDNDWALWVETVYPVHISKIGIVGTGSATAGGGITITAGGTDHNCHSIIRDIQITNVPTGIDSVRGCLIHLLDNSIYGYSTYGLRMRNTAYPDAGDQYISGNNFQVIGAGGIGTAAIQWESAGGARITANKFNTQGGAINATIATNTIIAAIIGNSFDNQTEFSVKVRASGADSFAFVNVTGNVFTGAGAAGYKAIDIGDASDDIDSVVIANNNMQAAGTAIALGSVEKVHVSGNLIGSFTTGISTTSVSTQVSLSQNTFYDVTTKLSLASDSNIRATSPLFASGYARSWSTGSNIQSIAEFGEAAYGSTANNAIMFLNGATGANSQRGMWWSYNGADLNFARFGTAKTAAPTTDLTIEAGGDVIVNNSLGVGTSGPSKKVSVGLSSGTNGYAIEYTPGAQEVWTLTANTSTGEIKNYGAANYFHTFYTDNAERWRISLTGMLQPAAHATYDIGLTGTRVRTVYGQAGEFFVSGGTSAGDYVTTRKLNIYDNAGLAAGWDMFAQGSMAGNSSITIRDNAGSRWLTGWRAISGVASNLMYSYASLLPAKRATVDGDAVNDSVFGNLGSNAVRWANIYGDSLYGNLADTDTLTKKVSPDTDLTWDLGDTVRRYNAIWAKSLIITTSGSIEPDSNNIGTLGRSGFRFNKLWVTDVDVSGSLGVGTSGPSKKVSVGLSSGTNGYAIEYTPGTQEVWTLTANTATGEIRHYAATNYFHTFYASGAARWRLTSAGMFHPESHDTYDIGLTGTRVRTVYAVNLDVSGTCTGCGSGSLPVADTTAIVKGSADATKLLAFEVDGLTTATTRTLTPQDYNYTIAGTNIAQTFSGANTYSAGQTFNGTNTFNANQTFGGDIRFSADNTYNIGVTGTRPTHIFTRNFSMSASGYINSGGTLNVQSGGTLDINTGGTLSANGSAGTSATKTVRASGGASDCTLVFTNGILTGGTC